MGGSLFESKFAGSFKRFMKNERYMITGNISDLGLWKCGKGKVFTHIPAKLILLFKINSTKNHLIKRGSKSSASKKSYINRFWKFFLKNF